MKANEMHENKSKTLKFSLVLMIIALIASCAIFPDDNLENPDCNKLQSGVLSTDTEIIKPEIDKLLKNLKPAQTTTDATGHKNNLDILVQRLNTQCGNIEVELICYACVWTYPAQSEIKVTTDSSGIRISRVIYILTSKERPLECNSIHRAF